MTGFDCVIAAIAMLPAAINPSLLVRQDELATTLCASGQTIEIPLGSPKLPGIVPSACCAKGCRSSRRNLRQSGKIDPAQ
ncbi:MAG: hypothetical protein WAT93_11950 [Pontixanthobacter sp.]